MLMGMTQGNMAQDMEREMALLFTCYPVQKRRQHDGLENPTLLEP